MPITFTKKQIDELKARVADWVGSDDAISETAHYPTMDAAEEFAKKMRVPLAAVQALMGIENMWEIRPTKTDKAITLTDEEINEYAE